MTIDDLNSSGAVAFSSPVVAVPRSRKRYARKFRNIRILRQDEIGGFMTGQIKRVGVVGAGTMGNGIAQVFAVAGYPVIMRDINQSAVDRAVATIAKSLDRLTSRGKLNESDGKQAL